MSSSISRRTLAKGAAWAAPVVAATASVPAYAASPVCPKDINQKVQAQFDLYASRLPDLSKITLRFYWAENSGSNGALHRVGLRAQITGASEWDIASFPYAFEFGQRNVDTSPAVNNVLGGKTGLGKNANVTMPKVWPPHGKWDKFTGEPLNGNKPKSVNDGYASQRDVLHATSFVDIYTADGLYTKLSTMSETTATPHADHISWILSLNNKDLAKGNEIVLVSSGWRDGSYDGGTIYTATGFRPLGFTPPSLESVKKAVDPNGTYKEGCVEAAYQLAVDAWEQSPERLGNLNVVYAGWGTGTIQDSAYSGTDYVWSHEVGAFEGTQTRGGKNMGSVTQGGKPVDFFNAFDSAGSLIRNGGDTFFGYQVNYTDGIW